MPSPATQFSYRFVGEPGRWSVPFCSNGSSLTFNEPIDIIWYTYLSNEAPDVPDRKFEQAKKDEFGGWHQQMADRNADEGYIWRASWNSTENKYDDPVPIDRVGTAPLIPIQEDTDNLITTFTDTTTPPTVSPNDASFTRVESGTVRWTFTRSTTTFTEEDYTELPPGFYIQKLVDSLSNLGRTIAVRARHVSGTGFFSDWTEEVTLTIDNIPDDVFSSKPPWDGSILLSDLQTSIANINMDKYWYWSGATDAWPDNVELTFGISRTSTSFMATTLRDDTSVEVDCGDANFALYNITERRRKVYELGERTTLVMTKVSEAGVPDFTGEVRLRSTSRLIRLPIQTYGAWWFSTTSTGTPTGGTATFHKQVDGGGFSAVGVPTWPGATNPTTQRPTTGNYFGAVSYPISSGGREWIGTDDSWTVLELNLNTHFPFAFFMASNTEPECPAEGTTADQAIAAGWVPTSEWAILSSENDEVWALTVSVSEADGTLSNCSVRGIWDGSIPGNALRLVLPSTTNVTPGGTIATDSPITLKARGGKPAKTGDEKYIYTITEADSALSALTIAPSGNGLEAQITGMVPETTPLGVHTLKVRVRDSANNVDDGEVLVDVVKNLVEIVPVDPINVTAGEEITEANKGIVVSARGGVSTTYTFSIVSQTVPGLSIAAHNEGTQGLITGTVDSTLATGVYGIRVKAVDTDGNAGEAEIIVHVVETGKPKFTVTVDDFSINQGQTLAQQVTVGDRGEAPYSYNLFIASRPTIPAGIDNTTNLTDLSISDTGEIQGTLPANAALGNYTLRISVTDSTTTAVSVDVVMTVTAPPIVITIADWFVRRGQNYTHDFSVSGGRAPYTNYSVMGHGSNVTANASDDSITGFVEIGATQGAREITLSLRDSNGTSASQTATLNIIAPLPVIDLVVPNATVTRPLQGEASVPVSIQVEGPTGGRSPYTYELISTVPPGFQISATGEITGSIAYDLVGSSFVIRVRARDANYSSAHADITQVEAEGTLTILNPSMELSVNRNQIQVPKDETIFEDAFIFSTNGGDNNYTYTAPDDTPDWLTLTESGTGADKVAKLTGRVPANQTDTVEVTVTVTDGLGTTDTATVSIVPVESIEVEVHDFEVEQGQMANGTYTVTGGTSPYSATVCSDFVWLSETSISGTVPEDAVPGVYTIIVCVVDTYGYKGAGEGKMRITPKTLTVTFPNFLGEQGRYVSQKTEVAGGARPYTYAVATDAGNNFILDIDTDGVINRFIPSNQSARNYQVTVTVTDNDGATDTHTATLRVIPKMVVSIPVNKVYMGGESISLQTALTNTTVMGVTEDTTLHYELCIGPRADWLSISETSGLITGTVPEETEDEDYGVVILVEQRNEDGEVVRFASGSATICTRENPLGITLANFEQSHNSNISKQVTRVGGKSPYAYTISSNVNIPDLAIDENGNITGRIPKGRVGNHILTIRVTDYFNTRVTIRTTLTAIVPPLAIGSIPHTYHKHGDTVSITPALSGGNSPFTWSTTLPTALSWLSFNTSTGVLSGTVPADAPLATYPLTLNVVDTADSSGTRRNQSISFNLQITDISIPVIPTQYLQSQGSVSDRIATYDLMTEGGVRPYGYRVTGGGGVVTGSVNSSTDVLTLRSINPATIGSYVLNVQVTDSIGDTFSRNVTARIYSPLQTHIAPVDRTYNQGQTFGVSGATILGIRVQNGVGPFTSELTITPSISGLTLTESDDGQAFYVTGMISRTEIPGQHQVTIKVTDSVIGTVVSETATLTINALPLEVSSISNVVYAPESTIDDIQVNAFYGHGPYTYAATGLPSGLSINSTTGVISGTLGTAATQQSYNVTVTVTDSNMDEVTTTFTILVTVLAVDPITDFSDSPGDSITPIQVMAVGGEAPYTYALAFNPTLSGITISSSGLITGDIPENAIAGEYVGTVTVTDSNMDEVTTTFTITLAASGSLPLIYTYTLPNTPIGTQQFTTYGEMADIANIAPELHSDFDYWEVSLRMQWTISGTGDYFISGGIGANNLTYRFATDPFVNPPDGLFKANGFLNVGTWDVTISDPTNELFRFRPGEIGYNSPLRWDVRRFFMGLRSQVSGLTITNLMVTWTLTPRRDAVASSVVVSNITNKTAARNFQLTVPYTISGGTSPYTTGLTVKGPAYPSQIAHQTVSQTSRNVLFRASTVGEYTIGVNVFDANGNYGYQTFTVTVT